MLIMTGVVFVVIGFVMHRLRRIAARQHRKMVSMSWSQIAEMRRNLGPVKRVFYGRTPSPHGGTLVMYVGLTLSVFGVLILLAGY